MIRFLSLALMAKRHVQFVFGSEEGQDFFEYLLIIAGVSLAILLAAVTVPDLFDGVLEGVCNAIESTTGIEVYDCASITS